MGFAGTVRAKRPRRDWLGIALVVCWAVFVGASVAIMVHVAMVEDARAQVVTQGEPVTPNRVGGKAWLSLLELELNRELAMWDYTVALRMVDDRAFVVGEVSTTDGEHEGDTFYCGIPCNVLDRKARGDSLSRQIRARLSRCIQGRRQYLETLPRVTVKL